jgi:hypothetical protein
VATKRASTKHAHPSPTPCATIADADRIRTRAIDRHSYGSDAPHFQLTPSEAAALGGDAHASCNRTCELGMSRATGEQYRHVLELFEESTRRPET